jgi:type I restriction enzyme S subunit
VVPAELDGAICSTGFAVLRCRGIQPLVLAHLLRHTFTTEQIVKENSGIAYPAIEEEKILDVVLPIDSSGLQAIFGVAEELDRARTLLREAENAFDHGLSTAVNVWMQK